MNCFGSAFRLALLVVVSALVSLGGTAFAATKQPGYPVPHITAPTVPTAVAPGGPGFTLKVYGANFINGSVVNWNKQARTTTFVSGHELDAQILASDIATNTAGLITVTTTSPGGPIISSTFAQFEVHAQITTVTFGPYQTTNLALPPLLVADVNGDGFLDIAGISSQLQSYLNDGKGMLSAGPFASRNVNGNGDAEFGDFNGDGIPDIIFVVGPYNSPRLQVNLGNGDGTFRPGFQFGHFGEPPRFILVGDFNQDGVLDVVVDTRRGVNLYFGNGDGSFLQGQVIAAGGLGPDGVVAGDFNGDGKLDLAAVVVGKASEQVRVLLGNGDGTFQKARTVATLVGASGNPPLMISDLNGDGIPDLLYTDGQQTTMLLGRGDGTFAKPVLFPDYTCGLAAADFNSDGKVDLLFGGQGGGMSALRLGNGDGTFLSAQSLPLGVSSPVVAWDFSADGKIDVADGLIYYLQQ